MLGVEGAGQILPTTKTDCNQKVGVQLEGQERQKKAVEREWQDGGGMMDGWVKGIIREDYTHQAEPSSGLGGALTPSLNWRDIALPKVSRAKFHY